MVAQRMGQRTFVTHYRGIVSDTEVFESKVPSLFNANKIIAMNIDIVKAKHALATLQEEKRAQQDRLQLAAQAKQQLDTTLHAHCQIASAKERFGLR